VAALLQVTDLSKSFDGVRALDGVTLSVERQCIVGLIGPNGSGKTTLFNLVCGFLAGEDGSIEFRGQSLAGIAPYVIAQSGIGRTFQDLRLLRKVTVLDNVMLAFQRQVGEGALSALASPGVGRHERCQRDKAMEWLTFVGLSEKAGGLGEALSYGQKKLLTIACCLAMEAELLLLDEPVAGIDLEMSQRILGLLQGLREQGKTIFLIEHNLDAIKAVCDSVIVLDEGRKITEGPPEEVMRDPSVLEAYLT